VLIDPRIRRRRIEVSRDAGRHRLRLVLGCLGMALATAVAAAVSRSPLLDVDYVDVRGAENTARHLVVSAGRLGSHPAMLDVDTAAVARRVESLPWVLDAGARRQWPGTIRIDVTERRPVAVVPAGDGRWASADVAGRVLHVGLDKPGGLPVIGNLAPPGPPGSSLVASAQAPLRVAAALPEELRRRVADLAIVAGGEVELQLAPPGPNVRLGPPVRLGEKLSVLVTVLAGADMAGVRVIDVRVPRAPALTRG
jgi:cell division protein FtsQ